MVYCCGVYGNEAMDILDALSKQPKIDRYAHSDRIICDDGMLSISDAVFECHMRALGFEIKEEQS